MPTATFRLLYVFLVLSPDRRRIVHFNVTANPSAAWTAQQLIEAFPFNTAPRYLVRDNNRIYGRQFSERIEGMGIKEIPIAKHSQWQNPYVERMIGTIRRECLDHVIVLGERHLKRLLTGYFDYYHLARPHQSLADKAPVRAMSSRPHMDRSFARRRSAACTIATAVAPRSSKLSSIFRLRTNSVVTRKLRAIRDL